MYRFLLTQTEMKYIRHFSQKHPLIICDELHSRDGIHCWMCKKPITARGISSSSSSFYRCASNAPDQYCHNFFLHEICEEAPNEIEYPMHRHPRLKLSHPTGLAEFICKACNRASQGYCYTCPGYYDKMCGFDICLTCAFQKDRNFKHPGHNYEEHTLSLVQRRALFRCDACGKNHEDSSYICNACPFWMHNQCASLPTTIECKFHDDHPLTLAYSLPERYCGFFRRMGFRQMCSICDKEVNPDYWLYYCVKCRFFAHIKCATSTDIPLRFNENDETPDDPNLFHFPLTNESSVDVMIQQFGKANIVTDDGDMPVGADYINHWAHKDHPLVLLDHVQLSNINTTEMMNRNDDQVLCDCCVRPILTDPFYGCVQCKFFLHTFCAELPLVAKHPLHEKHELVIHKHVKPNIYVKCHMCDNICNGMFFYCKPCNFYLDIKCASLPSKIKHAVHRHPLSFIQLSSDIIPFCKACGAYFDLDFNYRCAFGCIDCHFYLHGSCIFLLSTINHRWDPHPIPLVHPPIKDHPDEFYCEICEEEIDGTSYSFYFCRSCDQSFHVWCLHPYYGYSNVKFGATNITVDKHPHSLTLAAMQQHKLPHSKCGNCSDRIPDGSPMLECQPCYFRLCMKCDSSSSASVVEYFQKKYLVWL